MTYELTLKQDKVKPHQSTALHLLVAFAICISGALALFLYKLFKIGLQSTDPAHVLNLLKWSGVGIIAAGVVLFFLIIARNKWLKQPRVNAVFRVIELLVLLFFCGFCLFEGITILTVTYGILAATILAALFWETTGRSMKVYVEDEGVRMPFHAKRRFIAWKEIEAVLLRFNILTIDCADNKLYQWNVNYVGFDAGGFEKDCNEKIEDGKKKRVADW